MYTSGHKRPRLTIDQIASNQLATQNELLHCRQRPILTTYTSSPVDATMSTIVAAHSSCSSTPTLASPANQDATTPEPLNLSINNRNTSATSSHETSQHKTVTKQESWSPEPYRIGQYRDSKDYRNRRDSADSCDQPCSSVKSEDTADDAGKERRRRQKLANKDNLVCQVCGAKANGHNFGAITCESCKAFFRRNAQKNKDLKCNFENACKIDEFTRKFCTACRLNKCFLVNMKKEWILDEEALKKRKKLTRRSVKEEASGSEFDPSFFPAAFATSQLYGAGSMPLLPHPSALYMHMEPRLTTVSPENTEGRDYPPTAMTDEDRSEIDRIMENYPMMDYPSSVSSTATTPTAQQPTSVSSATSSSSRSLDSTEAASTSPQHTLPQTNNFPPLLVDIKTEPSSEPFVIVHPEDPPEDPANADDEEDERRASPQILAEHPLRKVTEDYVHRLIQFIRLLPEFDSLNEHDRTTVLKGGILEAFIMRSAIVFEDSGRSESLANPNNKSIVAEHLKFIRKFNAVAKWDKVIMILGAIVQLFSDDIPDLQNRDSITKAARRYDRLMQSYLRSKYTASEVKDLYQQIKRMLQDVRAYSQVFSQGIGNISDVEPLLREMFSIKSY
ncbi:vitamin D3 receptor B-like isoform X2 [Watersipora subatra]|uniref:vitamin D3 receptor B-like isoform X2 n=1 Tax=Watersipora subatra TaxID=2589382 RepID=UPI00355B0F74